MSYKMDGALDVITVVKKGVEVGGDVINKGADLHEIFCVLGFVKGLMRADVARMRAEKKPEITYAEAREKVDKELGLFFLHGESLVDKMIVSERSGSHFMQRLRDMVFNETEVKSFNDILKRETK